jgi:hypothetical protein
VGVPKLDTVKLVPVALWTAVAIALAKNVNSLEVSSLAAAVSLFSTVSFVALLELAVFGMLMT